MMRKIIFIIFLSTPLQAQTCKDTILTGTPDSRFVLQSSARVVIDKKTGLMWKRCLEGLSGANCQIGQMHRRTWSKALQRAEYLHFAGYNDWRVPNIKELASIIETKCYPVINLKIFPNDNLYSEGNVWSSSPSATYSQNAWYISFRPDYSGHISSPIISDTNKKHNYFVRLVRNK